MYADDICLFAPSALGLQKLLEMCYGFSQDKDISYSVHLCIYILYCILLYPCDNVHLIHWYN